MKLKKKEINSSAHFTDRVDSESGLSHPEMSVLARRCQDKLEIATKQIRPRFHFELYEIENIYI